MGADQKYIVKPLSAGEGIGIKLLDDLRATVRLVLSCLVLSAGNNISALATILNETAGRQC